MTDLHCAAAVGLVNDLIEDRLAPEERVAVELHMVVCEGCTATLGQMRATIALLGAMRGAPR
jgi:hypothetical protein